MLLPPALGSSPYPPVSVYGTGPARTIVAFLGSPSRSFPTLFRSASQQTFPQGDLPPCHIHCLHRSFHSRLLLSACVPTSSVYREHRIFNLLSIAYAFQPQLRSRLPQSRSALLWKPLVFGREDSHFTLATHSGILSSWQSTAPSGTASARHQCSPTRHHPRRNDESMASVICFSPVYFRRRTSRLVSYYALFE